MKDKKVSAKGFGWDFTENKHDYTYGGKPLTGVTSVLGVISKPALIQWAANMVVERIKECPVVTLPDEETLVGQTFYRVTEDDLAVARTAHAQKRDKAADTGTILHEVVEKYINECIEFHEGKPFLPEENPELQPFVDWAIKEEIRFLAAEKKLYSKKLWVAGTADFIFEKGGKTYIGDIKCKDRIWSREPMLQCAAYGLMYGKNKVGGYCVVRLKGGQIEPIWSFDVEGDTKGFLSALNLFRTMQNWAVTR